ncbi:MAG TPA: DJ-1/PfpI family protein [Aggregatilineales bacterium]|nr:DJ-1/PfpI family protein [Aggregatilineales bacterium]
MPEDSQRNVAIFIFDDVEVLDFAGPFEVFNLASELIDPSPFNVYTVADEDYPIQARGKLTVTPHFSFHDAPPPDLLIIPGGWGTRALLKKESILTWILEQENHVEYLMSVCTGALVLGQAGLLKHREATTHADAFDELHKISPDTIIIKDKRYVDTGGKIITSGGISAGIDMSLYMLNKLLGDEALAVVLKEMEYEWQQNG